MTKTLQSFPEDMIALLKEWQVELPSHSVLRELLIASWCASCELEEGERATFAIQWCDPSSASRQRPFILETSLPLSVPSIAKLASAIDYRQSSLGVFEMNGRVEIWGVVRHGTFADRYRKGAVFTGEMAMAADFGDFLRICVSAPGNIAVTYGDRHSVSLRAGEVVAPGLRALTRTTPLKAAVDKILTQAGVNEEPLHRTLYTMLIPQIAERVAEQRSGGTLILAGGDCFQHLKFRYKLKDSSTELADAVSDIMSPARADRWVMNPKGPKDIRGIVTTNFQDAVSFFADLSKIDGAVVLGPTLSLIGFGAKINWTPTDTLPVIHVNELSGKGDDGGELLRSLGTRHGSAAWLCFHAPDTIATVISEDGVVSCMHRHNDSLLLWRPVRLDIAGFD